MYKQRYYPKYAFVQVHKDKSVHQTMYKWISEN